jgi:glycosyltransferase involved in cell wall biosynthesis
MKIKIIQIDTSSSSYSVRDYIEDQYRSWNSKVGFKLKEFKPELEVECWTIERKFKKEHRSIKNGIKFRTFPTNLSLRHGMELSNRLIKALKQEEKEIAKENGKLIIHLHEYHGWLSYSILKNLKKRNNRTKIICQHHGGRNPFANLKKYKRLWFGFPIIARMQFLEDKLFKKADMIYVLSDEEKRYIEKRGKCKFQTMGIENGFFEKRDREKLRRELGFKNEKKYVLFVGRIRESKGIRELIYAMKKLRDVELLLVGQSDLKLKIGKNVKYLGPVYSDELKNYYSASDCLILPSYTEGAPVVFMEALASNLPVIATDVGGIRQMIEEGREGKIIRVKNISDIIESIKEVLRWKKKDLRKYAEKYKWDKIIKETIKDYEI